MSTGQKEKLVDNRHIKTIENMTKPGYKIVIVRTFDCSIVTYMIYFTKYVLSSLLNKCNFFISIFVIVHLIRH